MKTHTPEYKQWLHTLKVGDTVCRPAGHWSSLQGCATYSMHTIKRMTATQAVCDFRQHEVRFRLSDGKIVGQNYRYVEPVTEAIKAAYDKAIKETPTS